MRSRVNKKRKFHHPLTKSIIRGENVYSLTRKEAFRLETLGRKSFQCAELRQMGIDSFTRNLSSVSRLRKPIHQKGTNNELIIKGQLRKVSTDLSKNASECLQSFFLRLIVVGVPGKDPWLAEVLPSTLRLVSSDTIIG